MVYGSVAVGGLSAMVPYSSGRLSFPVSSSSYIYSQFRHVSGTPAPEGTQGVSITKLQILDVLIDQLSQIKRSGSAPHLATGPVSEERINAMIDQYEKEIRGARAAAEVMPYKPAPAAPSGVLVNLVA